MIQQPRVRTKTYGDRRFNKTASTPWNDLPSESRNEQSLDILKKNVKTYLFIELFIVILCKLLTLTVLQVFF